MRLAALGCVISMPGAASAINCGIPGFPFTITDEKLGSGADALGMKVLSNTATGERVEIIWESGGNTERVRLRSPTTGLLRDVLQTNNNNATAVRLNQHYAGNILLPFANRIRNGTYNFFGRAYLLPRNENTPGVRSDALHGFLFNRTLAVRDAGCTNATGVPSVYVTLGYRFDGSQQGSSATPGWPFKLDTALTYALSAGSLSIITRATSLETSQALPWFNGWHPYFAVGSVAQARVEFDSCRSSMQVLTMAPSPAHHGALSPAQARVELDSCRSDKSTTGAQWSHITMGEGAPRAGDLIPTGEATPWTRFDGSTPIGGDEERPSYMDDEFKSTLAQKALSTAAVCGPYIRHRIHDAGGDKSTIVLWADRQHAVTQIFTGSQELWGWSAIALEPMSALADAYNNGDGLTVLWPGETFEGIFGTAIE